MESEEIVVNSTQEPEEVLNSLDSDPVKRELIQRIGVVRKKFTDLEAFLHTKENTLRQREQELLEKEQDLTAREEQLKNNFSSFDEAANQDDYSRLEILRVIGNELRLNFSVLNGSPGATKNAELIVEVNRQLGEILEQL